LLDTGLNSDILDVVAIIPTIVGSLMNKLPESETGFEDIRNRCISVIDSVQTLVTRERAVIIFAWITKGLVIKGHPLAHELIAFILQRLDQIDLAAVYCKAVEIIIKDHEMGYLTKQCYAIQKVRFM
jgi:RNAPII transcription regulator C-terminal